MSTSIIETPASKPEVNPPDAQLLAALEQVRKHQRHLDAVTEFLRDHHDRFVGLRWSVWVPLAEVTINSRVGEERQTVAIARRFPGEWKCGVPHLYDASSLDWVAERNGVTIRIERAETVVPSPVRPRVATF